MISQDFKQRIKVGAIFLLQIYKVTTGTLLSLFVPQACSSDDYLDGSYTGLSNSDNGSRICTLQENFDNADGYHKTVLYWNMFSMFTFFTYYLIELRREEWAIKYLDIDNNKSDNSLKEIIRQEPELDRRMDKLNLLYYRTLMFNCGTYGINLGLSAKLVKDGYHSSSTLSCFISFALLVLMKLYNSLEVAQQSVKNDKMTSAYMSEFVSFNVLDEDYVKAKLENTLHKEEEELKNELRLEEIPITIEENRQARPDTPKPPKPPKPPKSLEVIIPSPI